MGTGDGDALHCSDQLWRDLVFIWSVESFGRWVVLQEWRERREERRL